MNIVVKKSFFPAAVAVFFAVAAMWCQGCSKEEHAQFRTAPVKRGDLVAAISATGTVEPEEVIDVGAQVAGRIIEFGKGENGKTVDYGSAVQAGTVLARIDDALYAADVTMAAAQLQQAKAGVQRAEADLAQMQAKLYQAERDWQRAQELGPSSRALAESSYDGYKSGFETARANVAVGKAAIVQAEGSVAQAQAALDRAQRNLGYCTITSPVKGVIIDRRVNIGQTVVSSLNAPSLFLLAKDLTRMQVWVSVNEADIGSIHPGQPVRFTVDTYPGETFRGHVGKVRLNATMTQNVVTYTVEVITDNSDGRLLPYLTANVQFELARRDKVLMVPNAALRWSPLPLQVAEEFRGLAEREARGISDAEVQQGGGEEGAKPGGENIWVQDGKSIRPLTVTKGLSNGSMTEVQGEGLVEGMAVITGERQAVRQSNTNPFTPQMLRGKRPGG